MSEIIGFAIFTSYFLIGYVITSIWRWVDGSELSLAQLLPALVVIFWPICVPLGFLFMFFESDWGIFDLLTNWLKKLEKKGEKK